MTKYQGIFSYQWPIFKA